MAKNLQSHINKISRIIILSSLFIVSVQMLPGCSNGPDWLSEKKKDSGIKGTRISVLELDSSTSADSTLAELKISVPDAVPNDIWYKSDGHPASLPGNVKLTQPLTSIVKVGAGDGASDGQFIKAAPIVADGKVFTISTDGKISAFDASNIKKKFWQTKLKFVNKDEKSLSTAGISYYQGKLYVASGYNQVDALDAITGKIIWTKTLSSIARAAPDVKDNTVFVNTIDNKVYALDAASGNMLWNHSGGSEDLSMFGTASPVVYEDMLIAPYSSGEVYALKAIDGHEIWSDVFTRKSIGAVKMMSDIDASPIIANGMVFVISNGGVLAASDIKTGKRVWEKSVSGMKTPWIAGDFLYLITNKNEIACIHAPSGGIKWVKQLQSYKKADSKDDPIQWSGPVMASDLLWIISSQGKLVALSPIDGEEKYSRKIQKGVYNPPVVADGAMYLYSNDAELIQLSDGNLKKLKEVVKPVEQKESIQNGAILKPTTENKGNVFNKVALGAENTSHKIIDGVKGLFGNKNAENVK